MNEIQFIKNSSMHIYIYIYIYIAYNTGKKTYKKLKKHQKLSF